MPTTLKTTITAQIDTVFKNLLDLSQPVDTLAKKAKIELANGTGANSADLCFHDTRTINASSNEDLDLAGSLAGPFGAAQVFVELRAILISAASANTNNVRITRPASNGVPLFLAASDGIDVPPGGVFLWSCPADGKVTVTASTGDLINVANSSSGTSVTYDVVIIGTSA
jgi:hypothetical protein